VVDGGKPQKIYKEHSSRIVAVCISDKAPIVASLSQGGEVKLWNVLSDEYNSVAKAKVAKSNLDWSKTMSFSKDGNFLAVPDGFNVVVFDEHLKEVLRVKGEVGKEIIGCLFSQDYLFS
jgi:WD40 repeat protein